MGWTNPLDYLKKTFGTSGSEATVATQSGTNSNQALGTAKPTQPNSVIQVKQTEADKSMGVQLERTTTSNEAPLVSTKTENTSNTTQSSVSMQEATKSSSQEFYGAGYFSSVETAEQDYGTCKQSAQNDEQLAGCAANAMQTIEKNPQKDSAQSVRVLEQVDEDVKDIQSRNKTKKTSSKKNNSIKSGSVTPKSVAKPKTIETVDAVESSDSVDTTQDSEETSSGGIISSLVDEAFSKIEDVKLNIAGNLPAGDLQDKFIKSYVKSGTQHTSEQSKKSLALIVKGLSEESEKLLHNRTADDILQNKDEGLISDLAQAQSQMREESQQAAIDYVKQLFGDEFGEAYMNALAQNAYNFAESNWDYVTDTVKSSGYESAQQSLETAKQEYNNSTQNANKSTEADKTAQESNTQKTESKAESKTETNSYESKTESKSATSKSTVEAVSEMKRSVNSGNPVINIVSSEKFKNSATKAKVEFIKTLNNKDKKEAVGQICNSTSALGLKSMMFSGLKKDIIKFLVQNHSAENIEKLKYLQNYLSISEKKQLNEYEQCLRENKSLATLGNNIFV